MQAGKAKAKVCMGRKVGASPVWYVPVNRIAESANQNGMLW